MEEAVLFCKGGGCTAKLGPGILSRVLERLPRGEHDPDLLVGLDSKDDAAVYRLTDDIALVQTLDFFPPMVEDPYTFGRIAAANALSDIYAMGGTVKTALNIVCFPQDGDLNVLGEILRGGAEQVTAAGGSLAGGHSIHDPEVKYGLSVTGVVRPDRLYPNNGGQPGDHLVLSKALGTGLICSAARVGETSEEALSAAVNSMTTLNKGAAEVLSRHTVHACTDVTGFGLLGHLHEMMDGTLSCVLRAESIPALPDALRCAEEFLLTAAAQRNRNHVAPFVRFGPGVTFALEELLFDPQTSGGLLAAVPAGEAAALVSELRELGLPAAEIGAVTARGAVEITVEKRERVYGTNLV